MITITGLLQFLEWIVLHLYELVQSKLRVPTIALSLACMWLALPPQHELTAWILLPPTPTNVSPSGNDWVLLAKSIDDRNRETGRRKRNK